jgi:uncharacterized protein
MLPNLKLSYYNHFIPHKDRNLYIVYNSFTNSMIELDWDNGLILSKLNSMEIHYLDIELIELLKTNGMIIPNELDEFVEVRKRANQQREKCEDLSSLFLVLAPTNSCNMNCPYCFQGDKSQVVPEPKVLDEANIQAMKKLVTQAVYKPHATPIKRISVEWFGGEPLMKKNVMRDFSEFVIALADENNIEYNASIVTNGTLLNAETWELMHTCRVNHLQITIDGSEGMHNQVRMYLNGKGTYEKIMNNLSIMPAGRHTVTIRINGDREVFTQLDGLFDDLEARGLWPQRSREISFDWAPKFYNFLGFNQNKQVYYTSYEYQKSREDFAKLRLKKYNDWAVKNDLRTKGLRVAYPDFSDFYCTTVESPNSLSIDGGGYIHKCYNTINNAERRIQHMNDFDPSAPGMDHYKKFDKTQMPDCRTCKALPICEETCNMRFVDFAESKICSPWKYFMEERMIAIYEQNFADKQKAETELAPVMNRSGNLVTG